MPTNDRDDEAGWREALYLVAAVLIWLGALYGLLGAPDDARNAPAGRVAALDCR